MVQLYKGIDEFSRMSDTIKNIVEELKDGRRTLQRPARANRAGYRSGTPTDTTGSNGNDARTNSGGGGHGDNGTLSGNPTTNGNVRPSGTVGNGAGTGNRSAEPSGGEHRGVQQSPTADSNPANTGGRTEQPTEQPTRANGGTRNTSEPAATRQGKPSVETPLSGPDAVLNLEVGAIETTPGTGKPKAKPLATSKTGKPEVPTVSRQTIAELCTWTIGTGFALLQSARPWANWQREQHECEPAGEALAEILKNAPPAVLENILKIQPIIAFTACMYALVKPGLDSEEMYARWLVEQRNNAGKMVNNGPIPTGNTGIESEAQGGNPAIANKTPRNPGTNGTGKNN